MVKIVDMTSALQQVREKAEFRISYSDKFGKHAGFEDGNSLQDIQNKAQKLRAKGFKIDKMGRNTSPVSEELSMKATFLNGDDKTFKGKTASDINKQVKEYEKKHNTGLQHDGPMVKEDLNKDDESVVKKVRDMLKGASDKHKSQAKVLDKALKSENEKNLEEGKYTIEYEVESDSNADDRYVGEDEMTVNASSPKEAAKKFGQEMNKLVKKAGRTSRSVLKVYMNDMDKDGVSLSDRELDKLNDHANDIIYKNIRNSYEEGMPGGANTSTKQGSASKSAKKKYRFGYRVADTTTKEKSLEEQAKELEEQLKTAEKELEELYIKEDKAYVIRFKRIKDKERMVVVFRNQHDADMYADNIKKQGGQVFSNKLEKIPYKVVDKK